METGSEPPSHSGEIMAPLSFTSMEAESATAAPSIDLSMHDASLETAPGMFDSLSQMDAPPEPVVDPPQPPGQSDLDDPMMDVQGPTLDTLVDQLMPEPALPQPEEPDPYLLMNQAFDQQMQMMDPSNMPGPPGM
jgi:hypothetical protein